MRSDDVSVTKEQLTTVACKTSVEVTYLHKFSIFALYSVVESVSWELYVYRTDPTWSDVSWLPWPFPTRIGTSRVLLYIVHSSVCHPPTDISLRFCCEYLHSTLHPLLQNTEILMYGWGMHAKKMENFPKKILRLPCTVTDHVLSYYL